MKTCPSCSKEHNQRGAYCSQHCQVKMKWRIWREKHPPYIQHCKVCHKEFASQRNRHRKYCSRSCQVKDKNYQSGLKNNPERYKIRHCDNCKGQLNHTQSKYCSRKCQYEKYEFKNEGTKRAKSENQRKYRTGKKWSTETKQKMRVSALKYLNRNGNFCPRIGSNEIALLDQQEKLDNCKIQRQYLLSDLGYVVDGYCLETNTVYEVYESFHHQQEQHDLERQKLIQNQLQCNFKVIWDEQNSQR